jgi:hypothetical protein
MSEISKILLGIEDVEDLYEIKDIINNNRIKENKYIEANDLKEYEIIRKKLNNLIDSSIKYETKNYEKFDITKDIIKNATKYQIKEENLEIIEKQIRILKPLINIFTIDNYKVKYSDGNFVPLDNTKVKINSNFIFNKNNKPVFLYKYMNINLGLYILSSGLKDIGSITIQSNYNKMMKYSINQDINNYIIISNKSNKYLNSFEDLKINFKLHNTNIKAGTYRSKLELNIFNDKQEGDKCIIYVCINIIPLIIRFSLSEKYSLKNNFISIFHFLKYSIFYILFLVNILQKIKN